MHSAAFKGKMDDVKRIVGENPLAANARGDLLRTPLMLASGAGHIEVPPPHRSLWVWVLERLKQGWRRGRGVV